MYMYICICITCFLSAYLPNNFLIPPFSNAKGPMKKGDFGEICAVDKVGALKPFKVSVAACAAACGAVYSRVCCSACCSVCCCR